MAYRAFDDAFVVVHGADNPTEAEWERYLQSIEATPTKATRILVVTYGGGPNATQRAHLNKIIYPKPPAVAVCTDAAMVRGIVTAIGWFNPRIRAFARDDVGRALTYLGVPELQALRMLPHIARLREAVAPPAKAG